VLSFLPSCFLGIIAIVLMTLVTCVCMIPLYILSLSKFLIRLPAWQRVCGRMVTGIAKIWIWGILSTLKLTQKISWDVEGTGNLSFGEWYFVNSNHQHWTDILVILKVLVGRIPFPKFFLKKELFWVPMLGTAWWALDYPFMKRYSKDFIEKHPELRGADLETTRKACARYKQSPVSIINFIEGTRFTKEKHDRQKSPYRHLLRPKAGGLAFAINAMAGRITDMLDVTIVYPEGPGSGKFWDFISGRVSRIVVRVRKLKIPEEFLSGDYECDPDFRKRFQEWVSGLWHKKDEQIERLTRKYNLAEYRQ